MITTNNHAYAEAVRSIISHGYTTNKKSYEYIHTEFGLNFRMCDVEAAILKEQLKKLDKYVKRRNEVASNIQNLLMVFLGFKRYLNIALPIIFSMVFLYLRKKEMSLLNI